MNNIEYVVCKPNFSSHCQSIQIKKQSDEVIKARVQVINCIRVGGTDFSKGMPLCP